jgi:hypothetical protein
MDYKDFILLPCKEYAKLFKLAGIGMTVEGIFAVYMVHKFNKWVKRTIFPKKED